MACGSGGYLSDNAAEPLLNELLERPARAVACEHREVVKVHIAASVRICDFFVVYFGKPVVCGYRAGVMKNKSADREGHG